MTYFYAFFAGFSVMFLSLGFAVFALMHRPEVRRSIIRGFLDGIAPYFPAIAVIDIEGKERLIQFSALRDSMLRLAEGQVARAVRSHHDGAVDPPSDDFDS